MAPYERTAAVCLPEEYRLWKASLTPGDDAWAGENLLDRRTCVRVEHTFL
jgi:hypothetical protein